MPALTKFDLALLAAQKTKRKTITLRPIEPTLTIERDLAVIYLRVVRLWRTLIAETVLPAYSATHERVVMDDVTGNLVAAIDRSKGETFRVVAEARQAAQTWVVRVEKWHASQWSKLVASGAGVQVGSVLLSEDASVQIGVALERNAALIRNVSSEMAKRVETTVWQGIANQTPRNKIAKELTEQLGITRRRAIGIARDQTGKLTSELDRLRQTQAGIEEYEWRSSHVLHYRPEHLAREGKVFRWDSPPKGGHPKTEINCSCSALARLTL